MAVNPWRDFLSAAQGRGESEVEDIEEALASMDMVSVESSNLSGIGYNAQLEVLQVAFNDGRLYVYFDVPPEVYQELLRAPSHGRYFYYNIRMSYSYEEV